MEGNNQKPYKQRFKGVENFLRRIAFNLGNTPSQTEVKIISCIPIDVTDLQQKIINLERQLFEIEKAKQHMPKTYDDDNEDNPTAHSDDQRHEPPPEQHPDQHPDQHTDQHPDQHHDQHNDQHNGQHNDQHHDQHKDQHKDHHKDKHHDQNHDQHHDQHDKEAKPATVVNTAFMRRSNAMSHSIKKPVQNFRSQQVSGHSGNTSSHQRKSNVSFVFPAISTSVGPTSGLREQYNNKDNEEFEKRLGNDLCKNIFRRRKKMKTNGGKSNIKTQLIYYAQENPKSPFHLKDKSLLRNPILNNEHHLISQSYLDSVVRRQYDLKNILEEFSDTSNFSKPICRDIEDTQKYPCPYESDVCSCCHGKFQNLDNFMTNDFSVDPIPRPCAYKHNEQDKTYYDCNLYDMVPVKETSVNFLKPDSLHKNDYKRQLDMKCWPEKYRTKCRYHPFIVNYHTQIPIRRLPNKKHVKQTRVKSDRSNKSEKRNGFETSKSCCIECSDIYRKAGAPGVKLRKSEPTRTILLRNEFAETDNNTIAQANNQSTQSKLFTNVENKTESTLNQIKSILQSVLQEVKINSNINTVPEIPKKDAVIQKGSSQNNMPGNSTFLHSFTYNNSCNTNPYLPSCSRQISPGQYCFPGVPYQPVKCLQNFPVFIHPATGRPMCACYYRHSSHKSSQHNKRATASTNTDGDIQKCSSKETEKLIKEIYKSMALNMDYPMKDNSLSESDDLKSSDINSINVSNKKEKSTEAEILKKQDIETEAMIPPLLLNTNKNKFVYTAASSQSDNNRLISDLSFGYTPARNNYTKEENFKEMERQSTDTVDKVDEDTDESTDETESDETIVLDENKQNKKEKKGLFKRMFNSVKLFKKRKEEERRKSESDEEQSEESDSDDYQTVHSGTNGTEMVNLRSNSRKQYSKIQTVLDQKNKLKTKRSPYLEQEYRRQWNEKLMFHDQQERYSSERPFSRPTTSQPSAKPVYWRNYEARRASVNQNVTSDILDPQSVNQKIVNETLSPKDIAENNNTNGKLAWIKKHNLGIHCGEQWKKFILEN